ncbi:MAG: PD40 domain-containing protein [Bacteroidetes bacterium]|nr:PD40 domain-containing protein [Bacteroidota bacterium]
MHRIIFATTTVILTTTAVFAQPQKSPYEIKDPKISIVTYRPEHDNSGIDMAKQFQGAKPLPTSQYLKEEKHLRNIRQLSFEGENAEAYLSPDDSHLCFQARGRGEGHCDQIFTMTLDGKNVKHISTGTGRTTCSYYMPDQAHILYASTFNSDDACPPEPDHSLGYVWPLYRSYDLYIADTNGVTIGRLTADTTFYDAEATISPVGDRIVFTSTRDGDIDLYSMKLDGTGIKRLTTELGYDGGAFYSLDGKQICFRAARPTGKDADEYKALLAKGLVKPGDLEIMVMNADGTGKKQLTHNGKANFCPFFYPDGKRVIFSSNMDDPQGREFDLYAVNTDGTGLERITYAKGFDGFAMFTRDGKHLVWCSNRNGSHPGNTNIFVADWVN